MNVLEGHLAKKAMEGIKEGVKEADASKRKGIFSEGNELGKKLMEREKGQINWAALEKAHHQMREEGKIEPLGEPVSDIKEGSAIFSRVFGDFPAFKLFKPEKRALTPEAKEMVRMLDVPYEKRFDIFAPQTLKEITDIYGIGRFARTALERELQKELGRKLNWDELSEIKLDHDVLDRLVKSGFIRSGPNCYAYSMGRVLDFSEKAIDHPMPGGLSGSEVDERAFLDRITRKDPEPFRQLMVEGWHKDCKAMGCELVEKIDGKKITLDYVPKEGERMIAMMRSKGIPDVHFMLREKDGTWTHKRGLTAPTRLDLDGKIITDPEHCETRFDKSDPTSGYEDFLGYYIVRPVEQV